MIWGACDLAQNLPKRNVITVFWKTYTFLIFKVHRQFKYKQMWLSLQNKRITSV